MNILFNIQNFLMWCAYMIKMVKDYFAPRNNDIYRASIVYDVYKPKGDKFLASDAFWRDEQDSWGDNEYSEHWVDVYREFKDGTIAKLLKKAPHCVGNIVIALNYTHNGKRYKYMSYHYPESWPIPNSVGFKIPIKEALLVGDSKTLNVTSKIKKCAGPDFNFHNQEINIRDLFFISLDDYKYLEITNLLNKKVKFEVDDKITLPLF